MARRIEPAAVQYSDLRQYRDALRAELIDQGTPRARQRKPAAVNAIMSPLRSFLIWCEGAGLIDRVPEFPKHVKLGPAERKAISPKDQKRVERVMEKLGNASDWAMWVVFLDCGLRVSELCALRWRDVELTRGRAELYIRHGKGDKEGKVELSTRARAALLVLAKPKPPAESPVFLSRKHGSAITPRGIQNVFEHYGRMSGVKMHPHQARHACATDMLNRGEQVPTVQAILRHRSPVTTLGYTHTTPEQRRRAVEREPESED